MASKKILIAPMDWGLGHTTRCIPLAHYYSKAGYEIYFAGNAVQQQLFSASCPFIKPLSLEGYNIIYPNKGWSFMLKMIAQLPQIKSTISSEQQWIEQQMKIHQFDVIISDNRYGMFHSKAKSILLTHQLNIQTGTFIGNTAIKSYLKKLINNFDKCWIIDRNDNALAGKLSAPIATKTPLTYIGWLSQFQSLSKKEFLISPMRTPYILVLLSGPEPARTQLEQLLIEKFKANSNQQYVFIGGKSKSITQQLPTNIQYINIADAKTTYQYTIHAEYVICRSGYSSVMDMIFLEKPAIYIPTPGQTEQILVAKNIAKATKSKVFNQYQLKENIPLPNPIVLPFSFQFQIPTL
jgi:predicted glycosyltransferase